MAVYTALARQGRAGALAYIRARASSAQTRDRHLTHAPVFSRACCRVRETQACDCMFTEQNKRERERDRAK